jgi:dihydrofolate synthase/folylpolyglutamate synthase
MYAREKEYLERLELLGTRLGLERARRFAAALGNPQYAYRTVHVVGTNGKSSTAHFLSAVLSAHGLRVGTYVSPHLVSLADRQLLDGRPATDQEFFELVRRLRPLAEEVNAGLPQGEEITQFEFLTLVALTYFKEADCDVAVVEAGLGGRCDATSIIRSEVQVLTSIALEHTELLGNDLLSILEEKAAVISRDGKVMAGELAPHLEERLRAICEERGAEVSFLHVDASVLDSTRDDGFDVLGLRDFYPDIRLESLGRYQRANAVLAIGAAELFLDRALDGEALRRGLAAARTPGRLEVVSERPLCILDGAHNPAGMEELIASVDHMLGNRRLIGVMAISRDKSAREMVERLAPRCDILFATQSTNARSLAAEDLAAIVEGLEDAPEVFIDSDACSALRSAYNLASSNQVVLVAGSLYLISDIKRGLGHGA